MVNNSKNVNFIKNQKVVPKLVPLDDVCQISEFLTQNWFCSPVREILGQKSSFLKKWNF